MRRRFSNVPPAPKVYEELANLPGSPYQLTAGVGVGANGSVTANPGEVVLLEVATGNLVVVPEVDLADVTKFVPV